MLARLEALDVGKPLKQGRADAVALARYLEFYGGAADKVHGADLAVPERLHRAHVARAARRDRPHRAVELPDADRRAQRRRRARDGQCLRAEAGRGGLPDGARLRPHLRRGRTAGRRAQRRDRASARKPAPRFRRIRGVAHLSFTGSVGDRAADPDRGRAERRAGHARARRQEPADRVRRRRPRCGAAVPRQRRDPERRPDLLGGLAHPGRAAGLRRGPRADGRALPGAEGRAGARRPRRRAGDLEAPARDRRALPRRRARQRAEGRRAGRAR